MLALLHYYDVNVLSYKYDFSASIARLNKLISSQSDQSSLLTFFIDSVQYEIIKILTSIHVSNCTCTHHTCVG